MIHIVAFATHKLGHFRVRRLLAILALGVVASCEQNQPPPSAPSTVTRAEWKGWSAPLCARDDFYGSFVCITHSGGYVRPRQAPLPRPYEQVKGRLVFMCSDEGGQESFIQIRGGINLSSGYFDAGGLVYLVVVKFDDERPITIEVAQSQKNDKLLYPHAQEAWISRVRTASEVIVRLPYSRAGNADFRFQLAGRDGADLRIRKALARCAAGR